MYSRPTYRGSKKRRVPLIEVLKVLTGPGKASHLSRFHHTQNIGFLAVPAQSVPLSDARVYKLSRVVSLFFIDSTWRSFLSAASKCFLFGHREESERRLDSLFQSPQNPNPAIPCLSVRSAFDLYLEVVKFPRGSQVLMTAVNVPGMTDVIRHHGLVPVAIGTVVAYFQSLH